MAALQAYSTFHARALKHKWECFTVYGVHTSSHGNYILVLLVVMATVYAMHIFLDLQGGTGFSASGVSLKATKSGAAMMV